jgi:catechol 2,3-dioxygenase-like lactoylglutathione lyase family enzyme
VHLVLAVADVELAVRFYGEALGWAPRLRQEDVYAELELPDGGVLGLYRRDGFERSAGVRVAEPGPGEHVGAELYVRVDDLDAAVERLDRAGATPLSGRSPRGWGDEAAYFGTPDGHVVAVAKRLDV